MTDDRTARIDELLDIQREDERAEALRNGSLLADMFDGKWLDAQHFPALQYAVPGIIPEGFGVLVSPPKAGKSWLVCGIGLACAIGGTALGTIRVPKRPVFYMALEDGERRLQTRCRQIMCGQPIPRGIHFITHAENSAIAFGMLFEFFGSHHDDKPLVILDTLGRAKPTRPASADPYQFDYKVGAQLKAAVDASPGATLLAVHHTRKAESSDFVDAVSGTHAIAASADFVLVLARKRHSDKAFLSVTGRDVPEAEYALTITDGCWQLAGRTLSESAREAETRRERARLGDRALEVLAMVNRQPQTRAGDLAALGISKEQARVYLGRLADTGRITKISRGIFAPRSAPITSVISVTSSSQDVTESTNITHLFQGPTPGRCDECGWHVDTQGHRPDCPANPDFEPPF